MKASDSIFNYSPLLEFPKDAFELIVNPRHVQVTQEQYLQARYDGWLFDKIHTTKNKRRDIVVEEQANMTLNVFVEDVVVMFAKKKDAMLFKLTYGVKDNEDL